MVEPELASSLINLLDFWISRSFCAFQRAKSISLLSIRPNGAQSSLLAVMQVTCHGISRHVIVTQPIIAIKDSLYEFVSPETPICDRPCFSS